MTAMSTSDTHRHIEDTAERFPEQMLLINHVFDFDFSEIEKVVERISSNIDLMQAFEQTAKYIEQSELPDMEKAQLMQLIGEETEVIAYAQTSRCSVIAI
ncbi:hypothetical protein [Epibacterium ulvae]|uniref:hypothetical protein n=1 Tax=Epibacterium ulvae TaxID=1156985 RepID=UPI0024921D2E|nr:hypothetical protein [Epibacterium ulvae]